MLPEGVKGAVKAPVVGMTLQCPLPLDAIPTGILQFVGR